MKNNIVSGLKYFFAIAILYWLWKSDRVDFSVLVKLFHPLYGPLILFLMLASLMLTFWRLNGLLKSQNINLPFKEVTKASLMGLFFNFTLPGGAGGDLVKAYYLLRDHKEKRGLLIGIIIADRLVGVFGLLLMAFVALLCRPSELQLQSDLQVLFAGLCLGILFFIFLLWYFSKQKRNLDQKMTQKFKFLNVKWIEKMHEIAVIIAEPKNVLKALMVTVISQAAAVLVLYFIGMASGSENVHLLVFFIVAPLGFLTTAIPISPGGIGVGQVAFYALFKIYTNDYSNLGPTVITAYQVLLFLFGLVGLGFYLSWGGKNNMKKSNV